LTVSSAAMGALNVLTVTSAGHGYSPGKNLVLAGGTVRNPLTASTLIDGTVQFTTVYDHDLITPSLPLDDLTLTLAGFGSVWDGEHTIIDVPNRRNFIVNLPNGEVAAPAVNESQYLKESIQTGIYSIDTVPTVDTFTFDLSSLASLAMGTVDDLRIISGFRIYAAADFKRAQAAYSEQQSGEACLFVIMADADVAKDRHTLNDGTAGFTRQDENLLRILQNFSTAVFIPSTEDLAGVDAQDLSYSTLFAALVSALYGYQMDGSIIKYLTVPVGHGPGEYNSAYYVHVYDWQLPGVINYEDGFLQSPDVAFRDMTQTLKLFADDEAEMVSNINLDDSPL